MTLKTYELHSKVMWAFHTIVVPVLLLGFGVVWVSLMLRSPRPDAPAPWFVVLWFIGLGWGSYRSLQMPYRIAVHDDGRLEFIGIVKRSLISPQEIISIKLKGFQSGLLVLRHTRGKILLFHQFSGFHELLSELKRSNPGVELVGC